MRQLEAEIAELKIERDDLKRSVVLSVKQATRWPCIVHREVRRSLHRFRGDYRLRASEGDDGRIGQSRGRTIVIEVDGKEVECVTIGPVGSRWSEATDVPSLGKDLPDPLPHVAGLSLPVIPGGYRSPNRIEAVFGRERSTCMQMYVSTCSLVILRTCIDIPLSTRNAKSSDSVGIAHNRLRRFVGGSERQLKAANEQPVIVPMYAVNSYARVPLTLDLAYLPIGGAHLSSSVPSLLQT